MAIKLITFIKKDIITGPTVDGLERLMNSDLGEKWKGSESIEHVRAHNACGRYTF